MPLDVTRRGFLSASGSADWGTVNKRYSASAPAPAGGQESLAPQEKLLHGRGCGHMVFLMYRSLCAPPSKTLFGPYLQDSGASTADAVKESTAVSRQRRSSELSKQRKAFFQVPALCSSLKTQIR